MIATAIITAPRPKPTLAASIVSFRKAGFHGHLHLNADGVLPAINPYSVSTCTVNTPALGNFRNWVAALEVIFAETQEPWLMVCEDDITWASGAAKKLHSELTALKTSSHLKSIGGLSLFLPIHESRHIEAKAGVKVLGEGWHAGARTGAKTWGAQCMVFSREMAIAILASPLLKSYRTDPKWTKNVDAIIANVIHSANRDIYYRVPCLVDHDLGYGNSSLGYADERPNLKTRYFDRIG